MHAGCNEDHRGVVRGELFVSRRDAPPLLEAIDASFDDVALAVARCIERKGPHPVGTRGDDWLDAPRKAVRKAALS
jgi:hypothetical protein